MILERQKAMKEDHEMTGAQLDAIRNELGLSFRELASALNMTGANAHDTLRKMVRGKSNITPTVALAVRELL